jgi:hypothetical protein
MKDESGQHKVHFCEFGHGSLHAQKDVLRTEDGAFKRYELLCSFHQFLHNAGQGPAPTVNIVVRRELWGGG